MTLSATVWQRVFLIKGIYNVAVSVVLLIWAKELLPLFGTPAGNPASSTSSPKRKAVSGVCSAGFKITQLPQANAGPSFQLASSSGKFHATIAPTTPTGSRNV